MNIFTPEYAVLAIILLYAAFAIVRDAKKHEGPKTAGKRIKKVA